MSNITYVILLITKALGLFTCKARKYFFKQWLSKTKCLPSKRTSVKPASTSKKDDTPVVPLLEEVVLTKRAEFAEFAVCRTRLATFAEIIHLKVNFYLIAKAGFFYSKQENKLTCFFCGGSFVNFHDIIDPWWQHAKWFPKCGFLLQNKGHDYVSQVESSMSVHRGKKENEIFDFDFDLSPIEYCKDKAEYENLNERKCLSLRSVWYGLTSLKQALLKRRQVDILLEILCKQKIEKLCIVCEENLSNAVTLPCSHLSACNECVQALQKCPKCKMDVKNFIYLTLD